MSQEETEEQAEAPDDDGDTSGGTEERPRRQLAIMIVEG